MDLLDGKDAAAPAGGVRAARPPDPPDGGD